MVDKDLSFSLPLELLRDSWLSFLYKLNLVFRKKSCSKQEWKIVWICIPASYRQGFKVLNTDTDPWTPENSVLKGDLDSMVVKNDVQASLAQPGALRSIMKSMWKRERVPVRGRGPGLSSRLQNLVLLGLGQVPLCLCTLRAQSSVRAQIREYKGIPYEEQKWIIIALIVTSYSSKNISIVRLFW